MKKYIYMAVAAIAALSSCSSDNDPIMGETGKQALVFTATMEGSEGTRATYNSGNKCASWEAGDQISINGKTYNAQSAGLATTFRAATVGEEAGGSPYEAYFPADLYNGATATLPAIQTYKDGKFNMPMYATSTTTDLAFKNLCAVLAIKVTSDDIEELKSIKVASDKKMNGPFTVTSTTGGGYMAVIGDDGGTNAVVLESSSALTLDEEGTTFYIAIPAQKYKYLNIFLSADGETYTQAMATKKVEGLGEIGRSKIFYIDYAKNATKMWEGNLFVADYNVGATSATEYGGYYAWGGSQDKVDDHNTTNEGSKNLSSTDDTATKLWGTNWRMPTLTELQDLIDNCNFAWEENYNESNIKGCIFTGKDDYATNSIFLPAVGAYIEAVVGGQGSYGCYWSSTPFGSGYGYYLCFAEGSQHVLYNNRSVGHSVRAVLVEAESPVPAPATTGTAKRTSDTGDIDVNWVQLWENGPKFAVYNVGAANNRPEDYGGHYAWGGNEDKGTSYVTGSDPLSGDTDTATKLWGSNWRMPTLEELQGLLDNCYVEWTAVNGVNGCKFTGKGDYSSNSVFLPAAGMCNGDFAYFQDETGDYWSSTPSGSGYAYNLDFISGGQSVFYDDYRISGYSVRAVLVEAESPVPAPATTGTAKATIGGSEVDVNWVQLWENGPKFAEYNVGATSATEYGGYYCWGKAIDQDPSRSYKYGESVLSGDDDTATNLWGSNWRMPTLEELQGLIDNCNFAWEENYNESNKNGCIFTGKDGYSSNSVFLPAAGYCFDVYVFGQGDRGYYWSSTPDGSSFACYLYFLSGLHYVNDDERRLGYSVRAVLAE